MLNELQLGALRVLEALDDKDQEVAYQVNLSNPVCPCCGAKLIIVDDTPKGQNEELNSENLDEQFADPSVIVPMIKEVANDLAEGYADYCREAYPTMTQQQLRDAIRYPSDPVLKDAINRKAKELKSIFNSSYGLIVNEQIIIQDLREILRDTSKTI